MYDWFTNRRTEKKKVILHIGRHKTGTTAIQNMLYKNRQSLDSLGFYYPESGVRGFGHHDVAIGMSGRIVLKTLGASMRSEIHLKFLREIENIKQGTLVVSSEEFQNSHPLLVKRYFKAFDVYPVCYLREQAEYLVSSYLQKVHNTNYCESIEIFYQQHFHVDYKKFLLRWSKAFSGKLTCKIYEKSALNGGLADKDFAINVLKLEPEQYSRWTVGGQGNPSINVRALAFKLEFNRRGFKSTPDLYRKLPTVSADTSHNEFGLTESFSKEIRLHYADTNRYVAGEFFGRNNLFSEYKNLTGSAVKEMDLERVFRDVLDELGYKERDFTR